MDLTEGQTAALTMVGDLVAADEAGFAVLTGYAGTGKTTLLRKVADILGAPTVLTPTGKAALRVTEATELPAQTIHRWLYKPQENPKTGELGFMRKPLDLIEIPSSSLIVIDEASMLSEAIWTDVWDVASQLGLRVLLVGDKFQLPPVVRKVDDAWQTFSALTDIKTSRRCDLTEVVRQAQDSPIIRASMMVRAGEMQAMEAVEDVLTCVPESQLISRFVSCNPTSRALVAHTNDKRQKLNGEVRAALGYTDALQLGEPLLVLQNNYFLDRFNGEVVSFEGWSTTPDEPIPVRDRFKNSVATMAFGIAKIEGMPAMVTEDEVFARPGVGNVGVSAIRRAAKDHAIAEWGYDAKLAPSYLSSNLGYCLTVHKSQGSEWDDVVVVVERTVGGRPGVFGYEGRRWLYTAITRAKRRVYLCFPG